eukprot:jgi/Mesvir1/10574/Mv21791-RA.1
MRLSLFPSPRQLSSAQALPGGKGKVIVFKVTAIAGVPAKVRNSIRRADFDRQHENEIAKYNAAVRAWNTSHALIFNETAWELRAGDLVVKLHVNNSQDVLADRDPHILPASGVKFEAESLLPPELLSGPDALASTREMFLERQYTLVGTSLATGDVSQMSLGSFPLVRKLAHRTPGWKVCRNSELGYWTCELSTMCTCEIYTMVSTMCLQVRLLADAAAPSGARWALSNQYGGYGCDAQHYWTPTLYKRVPAPPDGQPPLMSSQFSQLRIRSSMDPYLLAMNMTHGALYFAAMSAEENAVGAALLVIAFVLMLPPLIVFGPLVFDAWQRRRRRHEYSRGLDTEAKGGGPTGIIGRFQQL